jgi:hypothetical protein
MGKLKKMKKLTARAEERADRAEQAARRAEAAERRTVDLLNGRAARIGAPEAGGRPPIHTAPAVSS